MLFHKFQKVPPISFEMPLDFRQWGKKLPPKKICKVPTLGSVTTLLEWTQKHDSDRSNKEYCLWLETGWVKTGRSIEEANKSKKGQRIRGQGRQGQNRQVRNIL